MKHRLTAIATTGAIVSAFIFAPLSVVRAEPSSNLPANNLVAAAPTGELLQGIDIPFSTTLPNGGTFVADTLSITGFSYENGVLNATSVLTGTITQLNGTTTPISETFTTTATLTEGGASGVCDILFLDLGPIFLDVLGLEVDLSRIELDVNAVSGSGNLLGNLLCALVGLLDPEQGGSGQLQGILNLISRINNLLG